MDTSKLVPDDARVRRGEATVRGRTYRYVVGEPPGRPAADTVFLLHGFPDLGFGWRCQVPHLVALGLRVVVPDMLGYAGTDAPRDVAAFSPRSVADDIRELAAAFVGDGGQIVLGGHDWGGAIVWRIALWHPGLVKAVFSVCTPFSNPPRTDFVPLEKLIAAGKLTNFGYQLQLGGPDVEEAIQGEEKVRQFLCAMHGGTGPDGKSAFSPRDGVLLDELPKIGKPPLMSDEELDFYVQQYMLQDAPQLRGPLNWYRTRKINWEEELPLARNNNITFEMPTLFIAAANDRMLLPSMSVGMEKYMPNLTRGEVQSSHWALTQAPDAVNEQLTMWLSRVLGLRAPSAL